MNIIIPTADDVLSIQEQQGAYYFSAGFELVLRKHGFVQARTDSAISYRGGAGFVSRGTEWSQSFCEEPLIFEGPLHDSCLRALEIQADTIIVNKLRIMETSAGSKIPMAYWSMRTRKIPESVESFPEPEAFRCADSRWSIDDFDIQLLDANNECWEILLWGEIEGEDPFPVALEKDNKIVLGVPFLDILTFSSQQY